MSKINNVIELNAPPSTISGIPTEHIETFSHKCSYCGGNGWIWGAEEKRDCPICKGSGKLKAVVSIEWSPDK